LTPIFLAPVPRGGSKKIGVIPLRGLYVGSETSGRGVYGGPPTRSQILEMAKVGKVSTLISGEPEGGGTRVRLRLA